MTPEEINDNWVYVSKATVVEIAGLYALGCFKLWSRHNSRNIIDARWAITWKMIEGNVGAKGRFMVRGFKDQVQDLDTYAGTTGRSGQRLANAVTIGNLEFILFSFDVSQAFVKGMTFREFSALTGTEVREVEFHVPNADLGCLRQLPGFRDIDPAKEALTMLTPMYG